MSSCRCGQSKNKPYCDASHVAAAFTSSGEPATKSSEPLAARNGEVTIVGSENGPLVVTGNLELVSGTGRTIDRTASCKLCRCGGSQNKPYCDGTHKSNGFRT
jgi:CDGSH-type Zn-finger protein